MRRCVICLKDSDDVTLTQVVPASWTAFNNFVCICPRCKETEMYRKLVKQKKVIAPAVPREV
jgi:uncharacterized protein (DUF983 family)